MFGRNLNLPYKNFSIPPTLNYNDALSYCELLFPALKKVYTEVHASLFKVSENQEQYREKTAVTRNLKVGDAVWLFIPSIKLGQCIKLSKFNNGPYTKIENLNYVNFKISPQSNLSKTQVVHVDRLTAFKDRLSCFKTLQQQQSFDYESNGQSPTASGAHIDQSNPPFQRRRRRHNFVPAVASTKNQISVRETLAPHPEGSAESDSTAAEMRPPSLCSANQEDMQGKIQKA